jgi:O-antigen/teichoic acid export membrane protein
MINGLVTTLASNLDRFFIVTVFGTLFFGQYSFAMLLITAASLLQAIIYQHIGPSILFRIGKGQNPHLILKRLNRIVTVVSMSLVVIWFPFRILTKFIIERYFQDYVSTIPLLYILFFGGSLIMISHYEHFVVAIRKTKYLLAINVLIITVISLLFIVGLLLHLPVSWFGTFFVLGRLLYFLSTNVLAKRAVAKLEFNQKIYSGCF